MADFIHPENYEHTLLEHDDFPFNSFYIENSNTLPHWHNHTELIYIKTGSCDVYLNGLQYVCARGDILFIPSSSLHSILPKGSSHYYAVVVGDTLLQALFHDVHLKRVLEPFLSCKSLSPLHIQRIHPAHSSLLSSLETVIHEDQRKRLCFESIVKLELCRFFSLLIRNFPEHLAYSSRKQPQNTQILKRALEHLSRHYHEKITIHDMCRLTNISEQHFCRLFKAYTGKTFIAYLTLYRLDCAHKLLAATDLPITRIPELTGFCNANYFSRVYKNRYGQTPSSYRKILREKGDLY